MRKVGICLFFVLFVFCFINCQPGQRRTISDSVDRSVVHIDYGLADRLFELPVAGASGYAAVNIPVFRSPDLFANYIGTMDAGQGFTVLGEDGDWWHIEISTVRGWVMHKYCFINLPDIIPSIVYNITNTYYSLFRSSGMDIPNITGTALYNAWDYNARLGREEFIAPVLYAMAGKVFDAQKSALEEGNTLIMYEAFRPSQAHNYLHENFSQMVETNPLIRAGITADSFNIRWFLAEAPYNHQRGTAIDVSLGRIDDWETKTAGVLAYTYITGYTEYQMQTPIHELSVAAAVFDSSVHARSTTAWRDAEVLERASAETVLLQRYCTDAGLTPLASEWWHFNDLENTAVAIDLDITGEFLIERTYSRPLAYN